MLRKKEPCDLGDTFFKVFPDSMYGLPELPSVKEWKESW